MSFQNEVVVSVAGWVASDVRAGASSAGGGGRPWASFRFVWKARRYDKAQATFIDTPGNFVTVFCGWELAHNVTSCLEKGDPALVIGRLRVVETNRGNQNYRDVEIDAFAVGHNLALGTSVFRRLRPGRSADAGSSAAGTLVRPGRGSWDVESEELSPAAVVDPSELGITDDQAA